jgi:hypothetical protein
MKSILSIVWVCLLASILSGQGSIKSPQQYFKLYGQQHTPHHKVVEYLLYLDAASDKIEMEQYGESNQGRPMYTIYVSSASNIKNKENIRLTNLYNIGLHPTAPSTVIEKSIVYCSFGVHGNEAGTTESVLNIVYQLVTQTDANTSLYLDKAMIIIDPSLNPDGYDRYVHFLKSVSSAQGHPGAGDREHMEPWPSGRYNHYLYDLNRDWAWQVQTESQIRNKQYNKWMPHIHADFHEMGYNDNYYFAPAAQPYHEAITGFQRDFQTRIGKNHGKYFDDKGWLYWTREVFDLFYPSYGDTYPTYNGAIGMTYEQAGNSSSGRSISLDNGDTLTIQDKIDHNTCVAMSTIEMGARNADELVREFKKFFDTSRRNPNGKYKSYLVKAFPGMSRLTRLLDNNGISYEQASTSTRWNGGYLIGSKSAANQSIQVDPDDIIIQTAQPKSLMLNILMEEEPKIIDSLTYDITAWSIPLAYNTKVYAFTSVQSKGAAINTNKNALKLEEAAHYVMAWDDLKSVQDLAVLHKAGIKTRMALKESSFDGRMIKRGSIIINKGDNKYSSPLGKTLESLLPQAVAAGSIVAIPSGFADKIGDFGGSFFQLLRAPKVLSFAGRSMSTTGVGEVWHYFDQTLQYPVSVVEWDNFGRVNLAEYNTIILPDGYYSLGSKSEALSKWVNEGGRLIVIGNVVRNFEAVEGLKFERHATSSDADKAKEMDSLAMMDARAHAYDGQERRAIQGSTAGAIVKNKLDETHPLSFGLGQEYFSLKTSDQFFPLQKNSWNVATVPQKYTSFGFIGNKLKPKFENTVTFSVKNVGGGQAIFLVDNPLFRGFWDRGLLLFGNAVFLNGVTNSNY